MVGLRNVWQVETDRPEGNKLFLEQNCSKEKKKSKKTENKSKLVKKTKLNQEGETFCLACEERYSESDPRET